MDSSTFSVESCIFKVRFDNNNDISKIVDLGFKVSKAKDDPSMHRVEIDTLSRTVINQFFDLVEGKREPSESEDCPVGVDEVSDDSCILIPSDCTNTKPSSVLESSEDETKLYHTFDNEKRSDSQEKEYLAMKGDDSCVGKREGEEASEDDKDRFSPITATGKKEASQKEIEIEKGSDRNSSTEITKNVVSETSGGETEIGQKHLTQDTVSDRCTVKKTPGFVRPSNDFGQSEEFKCYEQCEDPDRKDETKKMEKDDTCHQNVVDVETGPKENTGGDISRMGIHENRDAKCEDAKLEQKKNAQSQTRHKISEGQNIEDNTNTTEETVEEYIQTAASQSAKNDDRKTGKYDRDADLENPKRSSGYDLINISQRSYADDEAKETVLDNKADVDNEEEEIELDKDCCERNGREKRYDSKEDLFLDCKDNFESEEKEKGRGDKINVGGGYNTSGPEFKFDEKEEGAAGGGDDDENGGQKDEDGHATVCSSIGFNKREYKLAMKNFKGQNENIYHCLEKAGHETSSYYTVEVDDIKSVERLTEFKKMLKTVKISNDNYSSMKEMNKTWDSCVSWDDCDSHLKLTASRDTHNEIKKEYPHLYSSGTNLPLSVSSDSTKDSQFKVNTNVDHQEADAQGVTEGQSVTKKRSKQPKSKDTFAGRRSNLVVKIYSANITKLHVDVIVNAANGRLKHHGGVAKAIAEAAGTKLKEDCESHTKSNRVNVSDHFASTGGKLKAKKVFHAVGPKWKLYKDRPENCKRDLRLTILRCLISAEQQGYQSIAFPSISAAIFKVPEEICVESYMKAVQHFEDWRYDHKTEKIQNIQFVDINDNMVNAIKEQFNRCWQSPVDDEEYRNDARIIDEEFIHNSTTHSGTNSDYNGKSGYRPSSKPRQLEMARLHSANSSRGGMRSSEVDTSTSNNGKQSTHGHRWSPPITSSNPSVTSPSYTVGATPSSGGKSTNEDTTSTTYAAATRASVTTRNQGAGISGNGTRPKSHPNFNEERNTSSGTTGSSEVDPPNLHSGGQSRHSHMSSSTPPITSSSVIPSLPSYSDVDPSHTSGATPSGGRKSPSKDKTSTTHAAMAVSSTTNSSLKVCPICQYTFIQLNKLECCGKFICSNCDQKTKNQCPYCRKITGIIRGDMPDGKMTIRFGVTNLPGFSVGVGHYEIQYFFDEFSFSKPYRTAYLPATKEGYGVLRLLMLAFARRLTFTKGTSLTAGKDNRIIWNGIHHKTSMKYGEAHGFPDQSYLQRVFEELTFRGVSADILSRDEVWYLDNWSKQLHQSGTTKIYVYKTR